MMELPRREYEQASEEPLPSKETDEILERHR
jgi:hypothetical protein